MAGDAAGALRLIRDEAKAPGECCSVLEGLGRGVETRLSLESFATRAERSSRFGVPSLLGVRVVG
jgi:hypothetical protein